MTAGEHEEAGASDEQRRGRRGPRSQRETGSASIALRVLACSAEPKRAAKIPSQLDKRTIRSGDTALDQVIVKIDASHKVLAYDPRRTVAGSSAAMSAGQMIGTLPGTRVLA